MHIENRFCRAIFSSDWNECLAPTNPFDPITFCHPELGRALEEIFREYTGNRIPLSKATRRIQGLLPAPITAQQMDAYLDAHFAVYTGVPELIRWCGERGVLFVINTTGMQGYFQRIFARGFLPQGPVVCGNPMVRYPDSTLDPLYEVIETQDKARNTEDIMKQAGVPAARVIVVGDSGGDGPHFRWGATVGATLIGSMTKWSLERYCMEQGIAIHHHFGLSYGEGEPRDEQREMQVDFMDLTGIIEQVVENR